MDVDSIPHKVPSHRLLHRAAKFSFEVKAFPYAFRDILPSVAVRLWIKIFTSGITVNMISEAITSTIVMNRIGSPVFLR